MLRTLMITTVLCLLMTVSVQASGFSVRQLSDARVGTAKEELVAQRDRSSQVISFFTVGHRWMVAPHHEQCWSIHGKRYRHLCDRARKQLIAHRWLHSLAVERLNRLYPSWPPHHALWMCIHGHEASDWQNQDTGHNGHYNGLQMHWSWGYGISGNPANYTQLEIEWAAERGYIASGFSYRWLTGQWAHYDCAEKYA